MKSINRPSTNWLRLTALLGALAILPAGLAVAQEDAPKRQNRQERIQRAQEGNNGIGQQIQQNRRAGIGGGQFGQEQREKAAEIRAKVAAGELTEEEGREQLAAYRQEMVQKAQEERKNAFLESTSKSLDEKVAAGELTPEQAKEQLDAAGKDFDEKNNPANRQASRLEGMKTRLDEAVEKGQMTREEADARLEQIAAQMNERLSNTLQLEQSDNLTTPAQIVTEPATSLPTIDRVQEKVMEIKPETKPTVKLPGKVKIEGQD